MKKLFLFAIVLFFPGCSLSENMEEAEAEVAAFHEMFNRKNYDGIYETGASELLDVMQRKEFFDLISSFREVLGPQVTSKMENFNFSSTLGTGTTFTGVYATVFENGKGTETFVYKKDGEGWKLLRYNLNSNDYIRLLREMAKT